MADRVPTSGPWQTDPMLQHLVRVLKAKMADPAAARMPRGGGYQAEAKALNDYVAANRMRLGIPDNYTVDIRTDGQTLYDPNQNQLRDALITGGAMAGGAYGIGAALGGGATQAPAFAEAGGLLPNTTPVPYSAVALNPPGAAAFGGSIAPNIASSAGGAAARGLLDKFSDPQSLAALAALGIGGASSLMGGPDNAMSDDAIKDEIAKSLAIQRGRLEQAQPAYDAMVNMAYGMSPTHYRGAAPAGFKAPQTDNPAYQYQAPRFGR
jgi:hypothetical protein